VVEKVLLSATDGFIDILVLELLGLFLWDYER
jgi:hypothetical protein